MLGKLYTLLPYDSMELVEYVGVYRCKWHDHPPLPDVAFVESGYTEEAIAELVMACEAMIIRYGRDCPEVTRARAAIAAALETLLDEEESDDVG